MGLLQGVRLYPKAIFWAVVMFEKSTRPFVLGSALAGAAGFVCASGQLHWQAQPPFAAASVFA